MEWCLPTQLQTSNIRPPQQKNISAPMPAPMLVLLPPTRAAFGDENTHHPPPPPSLLQKQKRAWARGLTREPPHSATAACRTIRWGFSTQSIRARVGRQTEKENRRPFRVLAAATAVLPRPGWLGPRGSKNVSSSLFASPLSLPPSLSSHLYEQSGGDSDDDKGKRDEAAAAAAEAVSARAHRRHVRVQRVKKGGPRWHELARRRRRERFK